MITTGTSRPLRKSYLVIPLEFPEALNLPKELVDQLGIANALAFTRLVAEQVLRQILPVDDAYRACICFRPKERTRDVQEWLAWARARATLEWNEGESHADRLAQALNLAFDDGADRVLLVDPYCLELKRSRIEELFNELDEHDLLVGPAADGQLAVLGTRRALPRDWLAQASMNNHSPCEVLTELAREQGLRALVLPEARRVRTPRDLDALAPETRAALPTKFRHALALLGVEDKVA
jgi:glycosyltransferase A (GT-A) superfamily protein (DUF2064 family)